MNDIDLAVDIYVSNLERKRKLTLIETERINFCKEILQKHVKEECLIGEYELFFEKDKVFIKEEDILGGKDILSHLMGCNRLVCFIVTLGCKIDRQINLYQYKDLAISLILDELASILIDVKSQKIEDKIRENNTTCERYSCGYGDYPLEKQSKICSLLKSEKIGVLLTTGGMFIPTKTISAVVGIKGE